MRYFKLAIFVFIVSVVLTACSPSSNMNPPKAKHGILDLTGWDLENNRLKRLYGKGLNINSIPGKGTEVTWRIPIKGRRRYN